MNCTCDPNTANCEMVNTRTAHPITKCPDILMNTSKAVNSSSTHSCTVPKEISDQTSEDPSAPTYPPRSPTSEIVPNELPLRHLYPRTSCETEASEGYIQQIDGNIETPYERTALGNLIGSVLQDSSPKGSCSAAKDSFHKTTNCVMSLYHNSKYGCTITPEEISDGNILGKMTDLIPSQANSVQDNGDIMAIAEKSTAISTSIRHYSSSSSVSSIGSSSSSIRGSISDTVSIVSCDSSGYGSEHYEITSESDCRSSTENINIIPNKAFKHDDIYFSVHGKGKVCAQNFSSFCKNQAFIKTKGDVIIKSYIITESPIFCF